MKKIAVLHDGDQVDLEFDVNIDDVITATNDNGDERHEVCYSIKERDGVQYYYFDQAQMCGCCSGEGNCGCGSDGSSGCGCGGH